MALVQGPEQGCVCEDTRPDDVDTGFFGPGYELPSSETLYHARRAQPPASERPAPGQGTTT